MSNLVKRKSHRQQKRRSPLILFLLILVWSLTLGWGLALATHAQTSTSGATTTVDPVPQSYQLGQELYLENCASCHIALPPAVLPTETWRQILQDSQHYGQQLTPLVDPARLLVWNYLQNFSRSVAKDEETPFRLNNSRYLKALHPKVKLPRPVQISSCVSCHPSAAEYNFRRLTPEWEKSP
ncbi:diheme cytochrome c [Chroococcidiopsis sp. CCMEE 29]|uniref:diheme cytochrome c n=1 Tax=Chroococcidiopsis sp. CCMEE 29 TaxID=155894 RepID=UPI0020227327|nr:diheme cytochrome c [Chroococcidiopsis sp. CCMEE 29]